MEKFINKTKQKIVTYFPNKKVYINLFVLGAQKGGTSALYEYLSKHPQIIHGKNKEINYFSQPLNYEKGHHWYHDCFPQNIPNHPFKKKYFLDATPEYLYHEEVAKRIYDYNPHAKLIIALREPVSRAYSAWNMYRDMNENLTNEEKQQTVDLHLKGLTTKHVNAFKEILYAQVMPSFENMIEDELKGNENLWGLLGRGLYYKQIQYYLQYYPMKQIYFVESKCLKQNKNAEVQNLYNFLGVDTQYAIKNNYPDVHVRKYTHQLSPDTKQKLQAFFHEPNQQLFTLLDTDYGWNKH